MPERDAPWLRDRLRGTELAGHRPTRLDAGMDSVAWRVADHVVRVPSRDEGATCLTDEITWLPRIGPLVGVAVTVSDVVVPPDAAFPWYVAGYPMIRGDTADRRHPDGLDCPAVAAAIADALDALHAVDLAPDDAPHDRWRKADLAFRVRDIEARLAAGVTARDWSSDDAGRWARAARRWASAAPLRTHETCWVHGDLHPRHVIVRDGWLAGLIDWGDLHRGDPAIDLSLAWTLLVGPARAAFLDRLEPSADVAARARLRALFYGLVFVSYGREVGDAVYVRTGRRTLAELDREMA